MYIIYQLFFLSPGTEIFIIICCRGSIETSNKSAPSEFISARVDVKVLLQCHNLRVNQEFIERELKVSDNEGWVWGWTG